MLRPPAPHTENRGQTGFNFYNLELPSDDETEQGDQYMTRNIFTSPPLPMSVIRDLQVK